MSADSTRDIADKMKKLKFRKTLFCGISEKDVWEKLEDLQADYRRAFDSQRAGYRALIEERDARIACLEAELRGRG